MPMTTTIQLKKTDKTAIARDWAKTSLKALKEVAPLVKHVPWLSAVAGTVIQVLELWDVSLPFHYLHLTLLFILSVI